MTTLNDVFNQTRTFELAGQLPIPLSVQIIHMGNFDGTSGHFTWTLPPGKTITTYETGPTGKPIRIVTQMPRVAQVYTLNVQLVFTLTNVQSTVTLTAAGQTVTAAPGQTSIAVTVAGSSLDVLWSLRSAGKIANDEIIIDRTAGALGTCIVPALPVLVVYDAVQNQAHTNAVTYTETRSLGMTTTFSATASKSINTQVVTAQDTLNQVTSLVTALGNVLAWMTSVASFDSSSGSGNSSSDGSVVQGIQLALNGYKALVGLFTSAIGSTTTTNNTSVETTQTHQLSVNIIDASSCMPDREGPGLGDQIVYLHNARFLWFADPNTNAVSFVYVSADAIAQVSASRLRAAVNTGNASASGTGLDLPTLQELFNLDPFCATAIPDLQDNPRFIGYPQNPDLNMMQHEFHGGGGGSLTFTQKITSDDLTRQVNTTTQTTTVKPGWLSLFGLEDPHNTVTVLQSSKSSSSELNVSDQVSTTATFNCAPTEDYAFIPYYDSVSGTFAFVPATLSASAIVSGTILDPSKKPLAHQRVILTTPGKTIATFTDDQGRYRFNSAGVVSGQLTIQSQNSSARVDYVEGHPQSLDLHVLSPVVPFESSSSSR